MKRCKICKGLHDVRDDGLCGGCYDNRMAGQFGMSYGKYIALYGHNLGRRTALQPESDRKCPVCGRSIPKYAGKHAVFCGKSCAGEAERARQNRVVKRKPVE